MGMGIVSARRHELTSLDVGAGYFVRGRMIFWPFLFFLDFAPRSFVMELGQAPVQAPVCRLFVACTFLLDKPRKALISIAQELHFAEVLF